MNRFSVTTLFIPFFFALFSGGDLSAQQTAISTKAMVVAPTPEAVQAGLTILRKDGNAVDAAAATAFALMVTDPANCSLGGRSQILIHLNTGEIIGIDGATQSPGTVSEPAKIGHGYRTCAIPGSPAALEAMVKEYGSLPLRVILQPAIQMARDGFVVRRDYHDAFREHGQLFRLYPGTAKHFLKEDGTFYAKGETFKQPALADTLEVIADRGAGALYRGELAQAVVRDMLNHDGLIRANDLAQYRHLPGAVLQGGYRGYRIISRGGQCDGASVIEMLQILEHFNLARHGFDDPVYLHLLAQAIYIGHMDEYLPDWLQVSNELAARRAREIEKTETLPLSAKPAEPRVGDTNHLSVIDEEGNAVSLSQSIGPAFGSKVANPELGFLYAFSYDMNEEPIPYLREKTSQCPTIVANEDKPFLILGAAGSSRIPASIVQTVVNVIDHKMDLDEAVSAPRVFIADCELRLEGHKLSESTISRLEELGYDMEVFEQLEGWFGRVHAILVDSASKRIYGAAGPRDWGDAGGF
jgi:gamma-glutamyltranspeptidase/glutathione hydrolase